MSRSSPKVSPAKGRAPWRPSPEGHAVGEDVGRRAQDSPRNCFGPCTPGPDQRAGDRHLDREERLAAGQEVVGGRRVGAEAGEAEVHHPHPPLVVDHQVVRLDVAVDQADRVGRREAAAGLGHDLEDLAPAPGALREPGAEGAAVDELHRHPDLVAVDADVVDRDDRGVAELGQRLGLADEAGPRVLLGGHRPADRHRVEELERDFAVELGIGGGVDHPHRPGAEAIEDDVAADQGAAGRSGPCPGCRRASVDLEPVDPGLDGRRR
ncbi:MAG: hypothetical protein R3B09_27230 [Nannocystaceae bacterium]